MSDLEVIFRWALVLVCVRGLGYFSLQKILSPLSSGIVLPFQLLLWAFFYWWWGSLGSLPNLFWAAFFTLIGSWAFFWVLFRFSKPRKNFPSWEADFWFWAVFAFSLLLRFYSPNIEGSEKFPDLQIFQAGFLDSHFPPQDRWLSGFPVNYYYFGQFLFVPLTRLTGISPEWAFSLSVCTILGMLASSVYSVVRKIGASPFFGCLGALSCVLFSNWEWVRQLWTFHAFFSWWNSSRAIQSTITEFPYFSFLLGDFHPHYISLPWLGVSLLLLLEFRESLNKESSWRSWILGFCLALSLGVHYPMNSWNFPWVALLALFLLFPRGKILLGLGVGSMVLFLPFWLSYEAPVSSIYWVPRILRSSLKEFFEHWGLFLVPWIFWLGLTWNPKQKKALLVLLGATFLVGLSLGWTLAFLVGLGGISFLNSHFSWKDPEWVLWTLCLFGWVICELISLDATYGKDLLRINTVFKFYIILWWMLSICTPLLYWRQREAWPISNFWKWGIFCLVSSLSLVFPIFGTPLYLKQFSRSPTLDGMAYWDSKFPGEREVVHWLRENTSPQDVILEAVGPPFQSFARFSSFSGRPALLGWANHERVWRRDKRRILQRERGILAIQEESRLSNVKKWVQENHIRWIILGNLERKTFSEAFLREVESFPKVFQTLTTVVYSTQ